MGRGGTYPDLAMMKGLDLIKDGNKNYVVKSSDSKDISELKRILHQNMFASVNMVVTKDIYDISESNFVYNGSSAVAGGHSLVCCGYDEDAKMLILQNHWGTKWGLKGFFLCPYDVWKNQCNLFCWYERVEASSVKPAVKEVVKEVIKEVVKEVEVPKMDSEKDKPDDSGSPKIETPKK